ncbi:hypothetical protein GALMADRAFT_221315 [Galerina marginata CBS 339.88]|uniref:Uncharacterized protein n=1 Tax=Galerina marginata (strain CBS 339.88) TaxID=685588 RepID=A0A067TGL2_GALM3|nr:hypothetical protein GALMADRAFT_221315 [Galerina marginata CBS 339.88]
MNVHSQDLASSHRRLARDSVWAQFSRRRHDNNARGQGQDNNNNKGGGGIGGGDDGGGGRGGNDPGKSNNDNPCQFGAFCHTPPSPPHNTKPVVPPAATPHTQPAQQSHTPDQPPSTHTPVAGNPSPTTPSSGGDPTENTSAGSSTIPVSQSPSSATGSPNLNQPVGDQISDGPNSGSASASLGQHGLPFGADPTSFTSSGTGPNNSAPATLNGVTSKGTDVGAIVGGLVGTISLVLLLLIVVWFIRRRHKNRSAPSSEFLGAGRTPFSGSANFQFRRIDDSNYDAQSRINSTNTPPIPESPTLPKSFLHMREKSDH